MSFSGGVRVRHLTFLLAAFSLAAFAADVTGVWKATAKTDAGPLELTFDLKANGETVTGTIECLSVKVNIEQGVVRGDHIVFAAIIEGWKFGFSGTWKGDEMTLSWIACCEGSHQPLDLGSVPIVAKRVK